VRGGSLTKDKINVALIVREPRGKGGRLWRPRGPVGAEMKGKEWGTREVNDLRIKIKWRKAGGDAGWGMYIF